jgi:hypothetical protein
MKIAATKSLMLAGVAVVVTSSLSMMWAQTSPNSKHPARVRPSQVFLTNAQLDPNENYQVIRAFVRTGSLEPNCFVTMGDTSFVANGTLVFCAPRQPSELGKGILISVFYPTAPPSGLTLSVTVSQETAKGYGAPVLCDVDGC